MFVTRGCFNPELLSRCAVSDTECSPLSPTLPRPPWSLPEVLDRAEPQSNPSPGSPPQKPPSSYTTQNLQLHPIHPHQRHPQSVKKTVPQEIPKPTDPRNQNPKKSLLNAVARGAPCHPRPANHTVPEAEAVPHAADWPAGGLCRPQGTREPHATCTSLVRKVGRAS